MGVTPECYTGSTEHQPGRARHQQVSVWGISKCVREECKHYGTSWPLTPTPRTPRQKAGILWEPTHGQFGH